MVEHRGGVVGSYTGVVEERLHARDNGVGADAKGKGAVSELVWLLGVVPLASTAVKEGEDARVRLEVEQCASLD